MGWESPDPWILLILEALPLNPRDRVLVVTSFQSCLFASVRWGGDTTDIFCYFWLLPCWYKNGWNSDFISVKKKMGFFSSEAWSLPWGEKTTLAGAALVWVWDKAISQRQFNSKVSQVTHLPLPCFLPRPPAWSLLWTRLVGPHPSPGTPRTLALASSV